MNASPVLTAPPPLAGLRKPELLAPVGRRECLRAAIENGADAVYFGLDDGFNARARATNLSIDELPEICAELHQRGVKGYLTLNTLIFTEELRTVEQLVRRASAAGVDAVIVQDLGLVRLIHQLCPEMPIHASTQMTLSSSECIAVATKLGLARVVLPRELSLAEITAVAQATTLPLEVFVHGALCVAYSGQCLTSEAMGGRSANRGQCAQACRLPYDLFCDDQPVDLGAVKYLLSPQDLAAFEMIPQLLAAGVSSFKIEGRLKTPEYVANITHHYRRAIDAAVAGQSAKFTAANVEEMELSFSRGFSPGWLEGINHKRLVPGESSSKRGVLLGTITSVRGDAVFLKLQTSLACGDGLVFDGDRAADAEQGGRVFALYQDDRSVTRANAGEVECRFGRDALDLTQLSPGQRAFKTDDPALTARIRKTFTGPDPQRRRLVTLFVKAVVGEPLHVEAELDANRPRVRISLDTPLPVAQRHPLTEQTLRDQFGRLGGTAFELADLHATIDGKPMVPFSVLGQMRHKLVAALEEQARQAPSRACGDESALGRLRSASAVARSAKERPVTEATNLHLMCRSLPQLQALLTVLATEPEAMRPASLMVDFADIREYREAVTSAREIAGLSIYLATPRIQKPGESGIFASLAKHEPAGILVRNLSGLRYCQDQQIPCVADYSLNAANELTMDWLLQQGCERVTASFDLNSDQLQSLATAVADDRLEVVIHQHMPMFHMEHCVFCAVLSPGTDKTNCGRPCDRHTVELADRVGRRHPLTADVGCRNTLFNAVPQSAAESVPALRSAGVRHFRLEFLNETPEKMLQAVRLYQDLLAGKTSGTFVWKSLQALNRTGVTRGSLED